MEGAVVGRADHEPCLGIVGNYSAEIPPVDYLLRCNRDPVREKHASLQGYRPLSAVSLTHPRCCQSPGNTPTAIDVSKSFVKLSKDQCFSVVRRNRSVAHVDCRAHPDGY